MRKTTLNQRCEALCKSFIVTSFTLLHFQALCLHTLSPPPGGSVTNLVYGELLEIRAAAGLSPRRNNRKEYEFFEEKNNSLLGEKTGNKIQRSANSNFQKTENKIKRSPTSKFQTGKQGGQTWRVKEGLTSGEAGGCFRASEASAQKKGLAFFGGAGK